MAQVTQNVVSFAEAGKQTKLSMSPSAVRSRERRAAAAAKKADQPTLVKAETAAKPKATPKARKMPTAAPIKVSAAQKRTIGQFCAAVAAGFLPIASFVLAHYESKSQPLLWVLVAAALMFSAPTLADWAGKWCGSKYKAWGFTVLLEGVMVASHTEVLSFAGLVILVAINSTNAWSLAAKKTVE